MVCAQANNTYRLYKEILQTPNSLRIFLLVCSSLVGPFAELKTEGFLEIKEEARIAGFLIV
jgi:hypothetical protein